MSGAAKRIDPRRPFHVTPRGLKRIVLGEVGTSDAAGAPALGHEPAPAPLRLSRDPTGHILVVAHSDRGALDAQAHQAVAAAALLADEATIVAVLVLGGLTEDLAASGADEVFVVPTLDDAAFAPEVELAVAGDLVASIAPRHILMPDNDTGDGDLGRRLAARLGIDVAAHVVEIDGDGVAACWWGGARMARRALPRLILLDPGTTDTALPFRGIGERIELDAPTVAQGAYADLGSAPVDIARVDLEEADFIVAAGNGVQDVRTLLAVANAFDAAVGASRVVVDDGRFPRDRQIGATGKTVTANVYMAVGISGAIQHLQGIRACRHVIAINTDMSAPIAERADLTIVDDARQVMGQLLEATRGRNRPRIEPAP